MAVRQSRSSGRLLLWREPVTCLRALSRGVTQAFPDKWRGPPFQSYWAPSSPPRTMPRSPRRSPKAVPTTGRVAGLPVRVFQGSPSIGCARCPGQGGRSATAETARISFFGSDPGPRAGSCPAISPPKKKKRLRRGRTRRTPMHRWGGGRIPPRRALRNSGPVDDPPLGARHEGARRLHARARAKLARESSRTGTRRSLLRFGPVASSRYPDDRTKPNPPYRRSFTAPQPHRPSGNGTQSTPKAESATTVSHICTSSGLVRRRVRGSAIGVY